MKIARDGKISVVIESLKNSATSGLNVVLSPEDCKLLLALLLQRKRPINQIVDGITTAAKDVIEAFGDDLKRGKI